MLRVCVRKGARVCMCVCVRQTENLIIVWHVSVMVQVNVTMCLIDLSTHSGTHLRPPRERSLRFRRLIRDVLHRPAL